jgi:hypothetical protein
MARRPPQDGPRIFSLDEANALVPELQLEFGRLATLRTEAAGLVELLGGGDEAMAVLQGTADPELGNGHATRLRALVLEMTGVVDRVIGLGCLVKDLDTGLVDFLSLREGEPVFLCWQLGEPRITHWHTVEGGFAGRQPIEGAPGRTGALPN